MRQLPSLRFAAALGLIALAAFTVPVFTADDAAKDAKGETIKGKVLAVQPGDGYFTLRTANDKEYTFYMDKAAQGRPNARDLKLGDLRVGTEVVVIYNVRGDRNVATAITTATAVGATEPATTVADEKPARVATDDKPKAEAFTRVGKIVKIDKSLKTMWVETPDEKEIKLTVPPEVRFKFKNDQTNLADLSVGTEVKVIYILDDDGKNVVTSLSDPTAPPDKSTTTAAQNANTGQGGTAQKPMRGGPTGPTVPPGGGGVAGALVLGTGANLTGNGNFTGKIARIKGDLIIMLTPENDFVVMTTANSREVLYMDQQTRIRLNNKEVRLTDLKEGMDVSIIYSAQNLGGSANVFHADIVTAVAAVTNAVNPAQPVITPIVIPQQPGTQPIPIGVGGQPQPSGQPGGQPAPQPQPGPRPGPQPQPQPGPQPRAR